MYKRIIASLLCMLLLVSSGCARIAAIFLEPSTAEPSSAAATPVTEEPTTHAGALEIDTGMKEYMLTYDYVDAADDSSAALEGYGMEDADADSPVADIRLVILGRSSDMSYSFIVRSVVSKNYANSGLYKASVWLYGRCGDRILFGISAYGGEISCYYLYNTATGELQTIGLMSLLRHMGNYFLMQPEIEEGKAAPLYFYDWTGRLVYTHESVADLTRSENDVYLLTAEPGALLRLDEDLFYEKEPDFSGALVTELGDYTGVFGIFEEDLVSLTRKDGGHFFTCRLEEAAERLGALAETPAETPAPITESCDLFSVTLPGFWQGRYACDTAENSLTFYHVPEKGERNYLFTLLLTPLADAVEYMARGVFLNRYVRDDEVRLNVAVSNADYESVETEADLFAAMLNSLDAVFATQKPVPAGARFEEFDYAFLKAAYTAQSASGTAYRITVDRIDRNVLIGEITGRTADGLDCRADLYVIMLDWVGYLVWTADSETKGDGVFYLEDGNPRIEIEGEEDAWTTTGGEIALTRVS